MPRFTYSLVALMILISVAPGLTLNAQSGVTVTTKSQVNLRGGPGTNFPTLAQIPTDTVLPAVGRNDKTSWIQVNFNNTVGWLSVGLLTPNGDLTTLPVIVPPAPLPFKTPTIPVFDDFTEPALDRWATVGNNFVQTIDNHTMYLNISWFLNSYVKNDRPLQEIDAWITMEQPDKGNAGINLTIVGSNVYTIAINHCKVIGINEIVSGNWINGNGFTLRDRGCPSSHLLGISVKGNRARFYLDGRLIDSRPWTGYITQAWIGGWADTNFQTDSSHSPNTNDPNFKPTIGRVNRVWVNFAP